MAKHSLGIQCAVGLMLNLGVNGLTENTSDEQLSHTQYDVNYHRQEIPIPAPTTTSSYDYWWPYPPAGALPVTTTFSVSSDWAATGTGAFALSFSLPSSSDNPNSISDSNIESTTSTSIDPSSSLVIATSATQLPISITALPPSNTSLSAGAHPKLSVQSQNLKLTYLIPVFVLIGILTGCLTAWCTYSCLMRKEKGGGKRGRQSWGSLEVGPEYKTPSAATLRAKAGEEGAWIGDKHDDQEEEQQPYGRPPHETNQGEQEAFLTPGAAGFTTPSRSSTRLTTTSNRTKSTRTRMGAVSPSPSHQISLIDRSTACSPCSQDDVPWESLRHKSIKREILARLQSEEDKRDMVGRRPAWQIHSKRDSDLLVTDVELLMSRAGSQATEPGVGFRMMVESPLPPIPSTRGRGDSQFSWDGVGADKYSPVPMRMASSRSHSRSRSPTKRSTNNRSPAKKGASLEKKASGDKDAGRTSGEDMRGVFPQSPPQISSPLLDGVLCFTPIPSSHVPTPSVPSFASFNLEKASKKDVRNGRL